MSTVQDLFSTLPTTMLGQYEGKEVYEIPRLPHAQCIVIPLIRETIAPILVRNNDAELTTEMHLAGSNRIRMIASKTKGVERRRGAQILRMLNLGGFAPANKAFKPKHKPMSAVFDLNTLIFGDSANGTQKAIYPVHAAVLYSDAISVESIRGQIDSVFRQGGISEDGGTYDIENRGTSSNIFTTYSVKPGTRFVQTLVLLGNRVTREAWDHLLLSIGIAGSYGGATAVTGTNLKTHMAGVYWGSLEQPINAPANVLEGLTGSMATHDMITHVAERFANAYAFGIAPHIVEDYLQGLMSQLDQEDTALVRQYGHGAKQAAELFDAWFKDKKVDRKGRASDATESEE